MAKVKLIAEEAVRIGKEVEVERLQGGNLVKLKLNSQKSVEPGDLFEVPEKLASDLIRLQAARKPEAASEKMPTAKDVKERPKNKAEAKLQLIDTIKGMSEDDEESWTRSGKPNVRALERRLGYDITEGERDEAWEEVQTEPDPSAKSNNGQGLGPTA